MTTGDSAGGAGSTNYWSRLARWVRRDLFLGAEVSFAGTIVATGVVEGDKWPRLLITLALLTAIWLFVPPSRVGRTPGDYAVAEAQAVVRRASRRMKAGFWARAILSGLAVGLAVSVPGSVGAAALIAVPVLLALILTFQAGLNEGVARGQRAAE